jgi:RNA polymerase sigma-70 factor (sigma-E family)
MTSLAAIVPAAEPASGEGSAEEAVTALYQAHALGLIRLAHIMLGNRHSAEDVVQDAFCGLYRRWSYLTDAGNALSYLRSSVLNGCRSALRRRVARPVEPAEQAKEQPVEISAESAMICDEDRRQVMEAVRGLPARQREALVLRFYLDLSAEEAARVMGVGASTVRSATHRALASLGRILGEDS